MIYFITNGFNTKIGKSRLIALQTSNARNLRLEYIFDIEDSTEKKLHKYFNKLFK